MQNTTEQRRSMGTRPAMAALRFMGWLELVVSFILFLFDVPLIALFFALASTFMASLALWVNNRGEWYDRELGIWQTDDTPPQPLRFTTRTAVGGVVALGLLIGAAVIFVTGGTTIIGLLLIAWAAAVTVQSVRGA